MGNKANINPPYLRDTGSQALKKPREQKWKHISSSLSSANSNDTTMEQLLLVTKQAVKNQKAELNFKRMRFEQMTQLRVKQMELQKPQFMEPIKVKMMSTNRKDTKSS